MRWWSIVVLGVIAAAVVSSGAAASTWLDMADYGNLHVVVAENATGSEVLAAKEFARYWQSCTGHAVTQSNTPSDGVNVFVGRNALPAKYAARVDWDALGADGLWLRSIAGDRTHAPALMIAGGREQGTLYGVYEFFERYIGVRWLAPDVTFIPGPPEKGVSNANPKPWERRTPSNLPKIRYQYTPPYGFRRTTLPTAGSADGKAEYTRACRLSDGPGFGLWVHTAYSLLPPEKYFKDHPEYYSEINGKRMAPPVYDTRNPKKYAAQHAQLCFSNPAVADAIVKELRERIKANPGPKGWSVSQMDWGNYCQCAECRAINEREGTPMGSLLTCVNRVADAIKKDYPDYYIKTIAYTWSRKAPKRLRPHDNVIIQLCSIECDFARPLTESFSRENAQFRRDIEDWSKIAKQLYIWDYTVDFAGYQRPHPNLQVLAPNERFFVKHRVTGVYEQGCGAPRAEMGYLRPYLLAKIVWDPQADLQAIQDEWLDLYYQEAAPYIRAYIDLARETLLDKDWMMTTYDPAGWMDLDFIKKARALFDQARDAAPTDAIRRRVDFAAVSVELGAIECPPRVTVDGDTMHLDRPDHLSSEAYIALAKKFGINEYAERQPIAEYGTSPRQLTSGVSEATIEVLENDRYLLWIVPALEGSVVRWQDKRSGAELLQAYRDYGRYPGTWQDWTNTPLYLEGPVAAQYTVADRSADSVTLQAERQDGLVVRRTMTLHPGSDVVEVTLTMTNPTDAPLVPNVKIHPEFFAQSIDIPEIWGCRDGQWQRLNQTGNIDPPQSTGAYLEPKGYTGLAFRVPKEQLTVTCTFDPASLGGLLWFYNAERVARQVNLELLPKSTPLAPGGSMSISGRYAITEKSPAAL